MNFVRVENEVSVLTVIYGSFITRSADDLIRDKATHVTLSTQNIDICNPFFAIDKYHKTCIKSLPLIRV